MHGSFLKHLFYDILALFALAVIVFCLEDEFKVSTPPYIVPLLSLGVCFGEYWIFEKTSPKSQNRFLTFLMILFIVGFFKAFGMRVDAALGYSIFCAVYIFLIATLKAQNAPKQQKVLTAQKTKKTIAEKTKITASIIVWKIIAFTFICIPYCFLYALQGFMSYSPQLWPLPIVLVLSGCVFFMSGICKYLSFLTLCLFSIAIDLSGMTGACDSDYYREYCHGHTYVFSRILIIFWGLYLAPGVIRSIANKIKSKKNPTKALKKARH